MTDTIIAGNQVKVYLGQKFGDKEGWYRGIVVKIDSYSEHRSFYWVELDAEAQAQLGIKQISVFNVKNIQKI